MKYKEERINLRDIDKTGTFSLEDPKRLEAINPKAIFSECCGLDGMFVQ